MKILLISAGSPASLEYQPPLGLAYLFSFLKQNGFPDIHFVDYYMTTERSLKKTLQKVQPDVVGISCVTPTRHRSIRIAQLVKEWVPKAVVVFGGIHATFLSEQTLEYYPQVDYVVRGEGEQTTIELLEYLQDGGNPEEIEGLTYRKDGRIIETPPRTKLKDLDRLPFPEYIEHYSHIEGGGRKSGAMITSRGCRGGCNYCSVPKFWGKSRFRSPLNVVDEMEYLVKVHDVGYIRVMDDTFSVDMERASVICEEILRRGLKVQWRCATRTDCVSRELLQLMKKAGCTRVSFGVESGSPKILKNIHKMVDLLQIEDACRWTKETGIILETCFMVGNVGETQETINETKALIQRIKPHEFRVSNSVYIFPGTPLYRFAADRGLIDDKRWLSSESVIPYTAEHNLGQLSKWQMEVIRECGRSKGFIQYIQYLFRNARRMRPKLLIKSGFYFLRANLVSLGSGFFGRK
jgi:anaerobic magnesium-protoporphyrin IX monomethyl ester cyclase